MEIHFPLRVDKDEVYVLNFTKRNEELKDVDVSNPDEFSAYIDEKLEETNCTVGIGKYNENRVVYETDLFGGEERRTVHLGIDVFVPAGTRIFTPLKGEVHSFQNNKARGDYGPTIILKHEKEGKIFYTLYGHLSLDSIEDLEVGQDFEKDEPLAKVGNSSINGGWPTHLHFEVINDMQGKRGDYPGVCSNSNREEYMELTSNPNSFLKISKLK